MTRARDLADSADKDIAGTLTLDGLTVDGTASIQPSSASIPSGGNTSADDLIIQSSGHTGMTIGSGTSSTGSIYFADSGSNSIGRIQYNHTDNSLYLQTNAEKRLNISSGGDISFYEDTGTTAKFFWDASAESLGIGTSSPSAELHIEKSSADAAVRLVRTGYGYTELIGSTGGSGNDFKINLNGTDRFYIQNSSGNVGIGTASPTVSLDVAGTGRFLKANNESNLILETTDDDTGAGPLLDLFRNSATPADGDNLANIRFRGVDDAAADISYAQIRAQIIDASSGSTDGRLILRATRNGTVEDKITCNGDSIIINNANSNTDFQVKSNDLTNMIFMNAANNSLGIGSNSQFATTAPRMFVHNDATGVAIETYRNTTTATSVIQAWHSDIGGTGIKTAEVEANGDFANTNNSYSSLSDQRLKQDIVDAASQWDDIKALQVRKYRFINHVETMGDDATVQLGVIAQELEASGMNGLVKTKPVDEADPDGPDRKSVNYSVLYMKAVKALQEAMERIETLETKVAALEAE